MEKHRCKLCYRKFANGRALGGHMKSHMMLLPVPPKPDSWPSLGSPPPTSSLPSSSGSEPEEGEIVKGKLVGKLRNNVKLVDRELFNVMLQDRESETESSKYVTRRRSKRTRKASSSIAQFIHQKDCNNNNNNNNNKLLLCDDNTSNSYYYNDVDQQQMGSSSISEVTSEEDVAFCLMMMSRDTWSDNGNGFGYGYEYGYGNKFCDGYDKECDNVRKRYKCDTCNKVFRSYQALGGHRASHKKTRVSILDHDHDNVAAAVVVNEEEKVHKCSICFRVFASGQALGGHKRSHVIDNQIKSGKIIHQIPKIKKKIIAENFIDLNLPAPIDDEDEEIVSQIATSSVSDVHL